MGDIIFQNRFQIQNGRFDPIDQGQHIDAEIFLEVGHGVKFVKNFLGISVFFEVDYEPDAIAVGFVADVTDAQNFSVAYGVS